MKLPDSVFAMVLLVTALTIAAPPAFPAPPQSRAEALAALKSADTATRAEAVVWIANRGSMTDAPLLQERLRDESAFVRNFAEQGLWLLWTRSGDAEIDALMARATEEMQASRYAQAIALLDQVVQKKPAFAEGWNRRATVHYLAGDLRKSIADCDEVLKRNPGAFRRALRPGPDLPADGRRAETRSSGSAARWRPIPTCSSVEMNIKMLEERLKGRRAPGQST